jgi:hypothetical protein
MPVTRDQVVAALKATAAIGEAIRELRVVPSGELYARIAGVVSLETFKGALDILRRTQLVRVLPDNRLEWIGEAVA